jgi:carboxyl-terminal processing protease
LVEKKSRLFMKRWSIFFVVVLLAYAFSGLRYGMAREGTGGLDLVFEVRDRIHRDYVDPVDSLLIIDAGVEGMLTALPEGDNDYLGQVERGGTGGDVHLGDRGQRQTLVEAFDHINRRSIEAISVDSLVRGTVWGMLTALDPHSSYLDAADYADMVERFRGDFEGIGIYFEVRDGKLLVISPIVGSPSYGKLRAGDHIAEIEGISTEGISTEEVMDKLRGARGSQVRVSVRRQGRENLLNFTIRRDRVEIRSVPYAYMLEEGIGYVRIVRFAETTAEELDRALEKLRAQGMHSLLLDLRDNGGGLLDQAVEVSDFFLRENELVVYTEGREGGRHEFRARRRLQEMMPLVVLIDHGSASASEIVAGAVQDLDMGIVAGQTSFGKGLVQGQFPLRSNGGLLLLTVARYYTPLGRLIQRPYSDDVQVYYEEGVDDVDPNTIDSLRAGKAVFYTQQGRAVYGGGGITPDVFLPAEKLSDLAVDLFTQGHLADFCGYWAGSHSDWPVNFEDYLHSYVVSEETYDAFASFLEKRSVEVDLAMLGEDRSFLQTELKAGFARVLWGDEQYYRARMLGDEQVKGALAFFPQALQLVQARRTY